MMMSFGMLGMVLFGGFLLALLVGAVILAFRRTPGACVADAQRPVARQLLDERFARGEISREEYDASRARLAD
jgi:putative membrane protein